MSEKPKTRDPFDPDLPAPEYEDAPTWGPKLPEDDDEKVYVAIEDLDEATVAEVRKEVERRAAEKVSDVPSGRLSTGGDGKPSGKEGNDGRVR